MLVPMPSGKSLEVAVEAVRGFAGKLIGPSLEEVGLTFGDQVRSFRMKQQIRFLPNGGLRGRVVLPDSFRYMGMRGDTMWGVFGDELDVQSVRIYTVSWS